jgi:hypothetical protein
MKTKKHCATCHCWLLSKTTDKDLELFMKAAEWQLAQLGGNKRAYRLFKKFNKPIARRKAKR